MSHVMCHVLHVMCHASHVACQYLFSYILHLLIQVYFHMVVSRLKGLGIKFNLKEVISDFELNIHKTIDDILKIYILGCFFHLAKVVMTKVDKKHMRKQYFYFLFLRSTAEFSAALDINPCSGPGCCFPRWKVVVPSPRPQCWA